MSPRQEDQTGEDPHGDDEPMEVPDEPERSLMDRWLHHDRERRQTAGPNPRRGCARWISWLAWNKG